MSTDSPARSYPVSHDDAEWRRRVETELSFEARMRRLERVYARLVAVRAGTGLAREHAW